MTIQLPPLKAPRAPVRTQRIPPGKRPHRRRRAAAYGPREGGPDPVDNADERRIPRGGSPRESRYRDWPAANDPQTPTVPGTQRSPGFGHPSARRGPTPSVIKPVKAARGGPQRDCGGRLAPVPGAGATHAASPTRHRSQRDSRPGREEEETGCPKSTQPSPTKAPGGTPEDKRPS